MKISFARVPLAKSLAAIGLLAAIAFLLYSALPAGASSHEPPDYDDDDNGLIEIETIAQLNMLRYDHNGDGFIDPTALGGRAPPIAPNTMPPTPTAPRLPAPPPPPPGWAAPPSAAAMSWR